MHGFVDTRWPRWAVDATMAEAGAANAARTTSSFALMVGGEMGVRTDSAGDAGGASFPVMVELLALVVLGWAVGSGLLHAAAAVEEV